MATQAWTIPPARSLPSAVIRDSRQEYILFFGRYPILSDETKQVVSGKVVDFILFGRVANYGFESEHKLRRSSR